jgi:hypothetical protein
MMTRRQRNLLIITLIALVFFLSLFFNYFNNAG